MFTDSSIIRLTVFEVWHHVVVQDAARSADLHLLGSAFTSGPFFGLMINTAVALLVLPSQEPDLAILAPIWPPGILNGPVHLAVALLHAVAHECNCVVDDRVLLAGVEDAVHVRAPGRGIHGNGHRAALAYCAQQLCVAVLLQPLPTVHELETGSIRACGMEADCSYVQICVTHGVALQERGRSTLAMPVDCLVRDVCSCLHRMVHGVLEGQLNGGSAAGT
mmetsp:Transcript_94388/g.131172  ORF Transcript_94388/g.131172 Transcript_94388/m.131172 type:complete len:221 (-) Transcript_94388:657-1319(-)